MTRELKNRTNDHVIEKILHDCSKNFDRASLLVRGVNENDLYDIYKNSLETLELLNLIDWSTITQCQYNRLSQTLDSWDSFSYRFDFEPPAIKIPEFPLGNLKAPNRLSQMIRGKVIKKGSDKTITVAVQYKQMHKKYKKVMTRTKKYLVHDEYNQASEGDYVLFRGSRPRSARKRHEILAIDRSIDAKPLEYREEDILLSN